MIKFEIYSKTEAIPPSPVSIFYTSFLIGNSSKCHLKVKSNSKDFPLLRCETNEDKITLETTNHHPFFLNGKKVLGLATIQINDIIKLEEVAIKIIELQLDSPCVELNHEKLYDDFYSNKDEYESILSAIEKELIYGTDDLISEKGSGANEL
jgi:hypothetical protein